MARRNEFADLAQLVLERDAQEEHEDRECCDGTGQIADPIEAARLGYDEPFIPCSGDHDFFNRPDIGYFEV